LPGLADNARLSGRVAIVTGGASGIGEATVRMLVANGASVAVLDVNLPSAMRVTADIEASGGRAITLEADVASAPSVDSAVHAVLDRFDRIDILVNNAGQSPKRAPLVEYTDEDFDRLVNSILRGTFNCTRAVLPHMIEKGYGRIVNVASIAYLGAPMFAVYAASKAAVVALATSVGAEVGRYGITANTVAPGLIDTPRTRNSVHYREHFEQQLKAIRSRDGIQRIGVPEDVARVIVFLASDESDYVTGQVIHVSGAPRR
jgi:3-oxoacyl-[acyl-carrier protein] reductase